MELIGFSAWKSLKESSGDESKIFQQPIDSYLKLRNVVLWSLPLSMGEDYDSTKGNLKFRVFLDFSDRGIEKMEIFLEEIVLEVVPLDEDDNKGDEIVLNFTREILKQCKTNIEINGFPIYLNELEIDMGRCEDNDGNVDLSKAEITAVFGVTD